MNLETDFASPDSATVGLRRSVLEAARIACEVRNEAISQAMPGLQFVSELWVLHDEDYEEAVRLLSESGASARAGAG
ncbi:MAG: DUF2007 domain-containing protein [Verrucomicrobia bacterium]|nr:DUF2007 domain-containing protein [Verrucomicrobiota bacterium]